MNQNNPKLAGVFGMMLASSLTIMVGSAITPALPEIGRVYELGNYASWLVTTPALGVVVFALLCGKILEKFGSYSTCTAGLILYGLLGIAGCCMPGIISVFIDRFLLGLATAVVMTSSTALISHFYRGERQLKMIAIQGMAIELGGVIFLSAGGHLAEISWKGPFGIYGIAFVAFLFLIFAVPSFKAEDEAAADMVQEKDHPRSNVFPVFLFAFLGMLVFFTAIVSIPSYLQIEKGYSSGFTGNYLAGISLIAVVFAGIMPRIVRRFSAKVSLLTAYSCYAVAHILLYFGSSLFLLIAAAVFMGIGFGFSTPLVNNLTVERSIAKRKARNLGFYSMATFLGQFLSSLIASTASGHSAFLRAAALAVITVFLVGFLFDRKKNPDRS